MRLVMGRGRLSAPFLIYTVPTFARMAHSTVLAAAGWHHWSCRYAPSQRVQIQPIAILLALNDMGIRTSISTLDINTIPPANLHHGLLYWRFYSCHLEMPPRSKEVRQCLLATRGNVPS